MTYRLLPQLAIFSIGAMYFAAHLASAIPPDADSQSSLVEVRIFSIWCDSLSCGGPIEILKDGTLIANGKPDAKLSESETEILARLITTTDFNSIQEQKFTGTCPVHLDGTQTIYSFGLKNQSIKLDSCKVQIPKDHDLFKSIDGIIQRYYTSKRRRPSTYEIDGRVYPVEE